MVEISCKDKIKEKMYALTNAEKKIANYVLDNYEDFLSDNITELAENADVSDATVVRFCRKIGYKGYQDFKVNAAKDMLPKEKHFNPALKEHDDSTAICNKIFNSEISVLNRTLAALDIKTIENAADLIYKSKKIFFFGTGASLLVGKDALHKFMKIGIRTYVYEDSELQLMASSLMQEGDLAIGISHSGSSQVVYKCLKNAKNNRASTIAIVSREKTPLAKISNLVIKTASEVTMFQSESVSSRIAQLAIIDSLIAIVAFKDYENSYSAIQNTRRATSENKF